MFNIREAIPSDASFLAQAEREIAKTPGFLVSQPHELDEERFLKKIWEFSSLNTDDSQSRVRTPGRGKYLVAESGNVLVGHAFLDPLPLSAICHVVHLTLAVHPGWQGKGVGKALLRALIDWASNTPQVEKIELQVRASNTLAQSLYKKLGFTEEGRWKGRIKVAKGAYIDDVLMGLWVKTIE